jgi:hypothetical protein
MPPVEPPLLSTSLDGHEATPRGNANAWPVVPGSRRYSGNRNRLNTTPRSTPPAGRPGHVRSTKPNFTCPRQARTPRAQPTHTKLRSPRECAG